MTRKLFLLFLCFVQFCEAQPAYPIVAAKEFSERFAVSPLNINSSFSEFSPFISKNKLYFISNRNTNVAVIYSSKSNQNTADIFVSNKMDSVTFSKPKNVTELNSVYDDGPIMLNAKGDYMVFSASNKKGKLQLYFSQLVNEKWTKPLLHPVSRVANSYCHPFLSTDGNTLFFCSDKEGGFGAMDIYYSKFQSFNWSNPVNLGAKVNSSANELFPFISAEKKLYFSSERPLGKGGLDIYSFNLNDSAKASVQLLISPVNSTYDDFAICYDSAQQNGYFSSNRNKN